MVSPLFSADRLPQKPYCSDDKTASRIRALATALRYTHIQFNPPHLINWLVLDLDFGGGTVPLDRAAHYYEDTLAPPPNIIVINPANGHAHYYYALRTPVARGEHARPEPLRYAQAVYRGLGALLDADPRYAQLLARNPLHPAHIALTPHGEPYELAALDEYLWDRHAGRAWQQAARAAGREVNALGRNCTVFDSARRWAYQWVNEYRETGAGLDAFAAACLRQAVAANEFAGHAQGALPANEVASIARSVARWTWRHYDGRRGSDDAFAARQSARGRCNGARKREDLLPQALALAAQGQSQRAIAAALGVSQKTVSNWLKRADAK